MATPDFKHEKERSVAQDGGSGESIGDVGAIAVEDDPYMRDFYGDSITASYRMKSEMVSKHMELIGMGRYQWELFVVTGFGWITDNFWSQGIGAVQPAIKLEFTDVTAVSYSSVAYYVGLILGASFWGIGADFIGRKPAFNTTLLLGGVFACAAAGSLNFLAFSALWAVVGTAAGGNVPVDSLIFLEFVPGSHQYLLTMLSAWWNLGQVIVSLVSWAFIANYSCTDAATCRREDNMGWRYILITLGLTALVFAAVRIFVFKMPESPRYLLSKGRDLEAIEAVNYVARRNGKPDLILTIEQLRAVDEQLGIPVNTDSKPIGLSRGQILKNSLQDFHGVGIKKLFATRKLGRHTALTWLIWLSIGTAYPLYFNFLPSYLAQKFSSMDSMSVSYRNYCIESIVGAFGPVAAAICVNTRFGRRWMMGGSAIITGIFLFGYVGANSETANIAFSCISGLWGNFEYAIMFAFTPESFPGPVRGTGVGIAATLQRIGGLIAAVVSSQVGFNVAPIYASAAIWVVMGFVCFGLPYETHGRAAL